MIPEIDLFHDVCVDGDVSLMLDLQGLLHDKSRHDFLDGLFNPPSSLSDISEASLAKVVGKATVRIDATTLETKSEFALLREIFEYGMALAEMHRAKASSHAAMM